VVYIYDIQGNMIKRLKDEQDENEEQKIYKCQNIFIWYHIIFKEYGKKLKI